MIFCRIDPDWLFGGLGIIVDSFLKYNAVENCRSAVLVLPFLLKFSRGITKCVKLHPIMEARANWRGCTCLMGA